MTRTPSYCDLRVSANTPLHTDQVRPLLLIIFHTGTHRGVPAIDRRFEATRGVEGEEKQKEA